MEKIKIELFKVIFIKEINVISIQIVIIKLIRDNKEIYLLKTVSESDENNNKVTIVITAVKEVNTVPSFSLSMLSVTLSGLLAAIGISLRQR